jgi:GNAT superfamily N-acetyltransferase
MTVRIETMPEMRRATTAGVPALSPLVEDYWSLERIPGFDPQRVAAQLARLLSESDRGGGWIALADDTAVGYLLAVYVVSLEHLGLTAEIDELFVVPPHRGNKVGRALLMAAESEFVRAGCTNVSLQLSRGNDSARAFYHRHGYTERSGFELLEKALDEG